MSGPTSEVFENFSGWAYVKYPDGNYEKIQTCHIEGFQPEDKNDFTHGHKYVVRSQQWKGKRFKGYIVRMEENLNDLVVSIAKERVKFPVLQESEDDILTSASEHDRKKSFQAYNKPASVRKLKSKAAGEDLDSFLKKVTLPTSKQITSHNISKSSVNQKKSVGQKSSASRKSPVSQKPSLNHNNSGSQSSSVNENTLAFQKAAPLNLKTKLKPPPAQSTASSSMSSMPLTEAQSDSFSHPQQKASKSSSLEPAMCSKTLNNLPSTSSVSSKDDNLPITVNSSVLTQQLKNTSLSNKSKKSLSMSISKLSSTPETTDCLSNSTSVSKGPSEKPPVARASQSPVSIPLNTFEESILNMIRNEVVLRLDKLEKRIEKLPTAEEVRALSTHVSALETLVKQGSTQSSSANTTQTCSADSGSSSLGDTTAKVLLGPNISMAKRAWEQMNTTESEDEWCIALLLGVFGEEAKHYCCQERKDGKRKKFPFAFTSVATDQYREFLKRTKNNGPFLKKDVNKILGKLSRKANDLNGRRNKPKMTNEAVQEPVEETLALVDPATGMLLSVNSGKPLEANVENGDQLADDDAESPEQVGEILDESELDEDIHTEALNKEAEEFFRTLLDD